MSTASATLTTWEEFLLLPDEEEYEKGNHLELHDGEVVVVPPPRAVHTYKQAWLVKWFTLVAQGQGYAMAEFPIAPPQIFSSGAPMSLIFPTKIGKPCAGRLSGLLPASHC